MNQNKVPVFPWELNVMIAAILVAIVYGVATNDAVGMAAILAATYVGLSVTTKQGKTALAGMAVICCGTLAFAIVNKAGIHWSGVACLTYFVVTFAAAGALAVQINNREIAAAFGNRNRQIQTF
ncbi:MAG TPA: hypothetical protein VGE59_03980 [Patescibacteria group bacterium]